MVSQAVDHQHKVVKDTAVGEVVGMYGGQTFTIGGDSQVVCGVYVVPDTSLSCARKAIAPMYITYRDVHQLLLFLIELHLKENVLVWHVAGNRCDTRWLDSSNFRT